MIVKEFELDQPLIHKIDSLIDKSIRDCHNKHFLTFDHICEYDIQLTNITINETVNFTISDKSLGLYELNKSLTDARGNGFIFDQINKLTLKIYNNLSQIYIHFYPKLQIPIMHRHFFSKPSQNLEYIPTHCNDRRNPSHFACRKWYLYNNPQC